MDFVFRRYQGAAPLLMRLPWKEGWAVVRAGRERQERDRMWQAYCCLYPFMTEDNFVEFSEWYEGLKPRPPVKKQTVGDIMERVNGIINMTLGG